MKKFFIILVALFLVSGAMAQSCLPEGIAFTSQNQIDSFQINYPNCTQIEGYVAINGGKITNLYSLSILTSIGGNLSIYGNDVLSSLTGLEGLTSIGGDLSIFHNAALTSLTGIDNIAAGSIINLTIVYNPTLSTCEIKSICDYLAAPNGEVAIHDNATGFSSQEEVHLACTFGLDENGTKDPHITISPNPASSTITISTPTTPDKNTIMTIYNLSGQQLISRQITKQETDVDVSGLVQGIYIVRVVDDRTVMVGKFVKQ